MQIRHPRDAVRHGIAYLSEDRKRYGLALGLDVETNIALASLRKFINGLGWVNTNRTHKTAQQHVQVLERYAGHVREQDSRQRVVVRARAAAP